MTPKISVILPVYNGGEYLQEAINSILMQTYHNLEVIIINDGSTDNSESIINSFRDSRIKYYQNTKNIGIAKSLNRAIKSAKGEFIARQDADDVSQPNRLAKQLEYFHQNQKYALVGTWAKVLDEGTLIVKSPAQPISNAAIKYYLLFDNPFIHSSVMLSKSKLTEDFLYNEKLNCAQDYELWSRISRKFLVANLPEYLVIHRNIRTSISYTRRQEIRQNVLKQNWENYQHILGNDEFEVFKDAVYLYRRDYSKYTAKFNLSSIKNVMLRVRGSINKNPSEELIFTYSWFWKIIKNSYFEYNYPLLFKPLKLFGLVK